MVTQTSSYSTALLAAIKLLRALKPETANAIVAAEVRHRKRVADDTQAEYPSTIEQIWYPGSNGELLPADPTASTQPPLSTGRDEELYRSSAGESPEYLHLRIDTLSRPVVANDDHWR